MADRCVSDKSHVVPNFFHSLDLEIDCVCLLTSSCEKKEKF